MLAESFSKYIISVFVLLLSVAVLLYGASSKNVNDFEKSHITLAENSVEHTSLLISLYLNNIRHDVNVYTIQFADEIRYLANNPHHEQTKLALSQSLRDYFPDAFTYTIANSSGDVLLDDVEGLVGKGCRENIRLFAIDNQQSDAAIRIHSDKYDYHFDVMNELQMDDGRIIIYFITFKPNVIAGYLEHIQPSNHQLYVIKQRSNNLIEVFSEGARVKLQRKDKRLSADEVNRIQAVADIEDTLWTIIDVIQQDVIVNEKQRIIYQTLLIFLVFVLLGALSLSIISRHEHKRRQVELLLDEHRQILEEKVIERTNELYFVKEKIKGMALSDGLTGITNRSHFDHVFARDLKRANASNDPLSVILFSVDNFKHYNEVAGYQAGDNCLKKMTSHIASILERTDGHELFARYDSVEFVVLLPNYDGNKAHELAKEIVQCVADLNIAHKECDTADRVTISVGVVSINKDNYMTFDALSDRMEELLYRAKVQGKNQIMLDI